MKAIFFKKISFQDSSGKDALFFFLIVLYLFSIFLLEKFLPLNRIALCLLFVFGVFHKNKENDRFVFNRNGFLMQVFILLPLFYTILEQCNSRILALNIIYLIFFFLFSTQWFKGPETTYTIYRALYVSLMLVFGICLFGIAQYFYENFFSIFPFDRAIVEIRNTLWWNAFVHKSLMHPLGLHPSYVSIFCLAVINWNLNEVLEKLKQNLVMEINKISLILPIFFLLLISSKMAYALLMILLFIFLVRLFRHKMYKLLFLISTIIVLTTISIFSYFPSIKHRVTVDYVEFKKSGFKLDNVSKASERLLVWNTSWRLLKKNPKGSYCEDTKDLIWSALEKQNKAELEKKNAHNNFLEFGLRYGLVGVLVLMLFIGYSVLKVVQNKDVTLLGILLIFFMFSIVEATLVREIGVIFMAFLFQFHLINTQNKCYK